MATELQKPAIKRLAATRHLLTLAPRHLLQTLSAPHSTPHTPHPTPHPIQLTISIADPGPTHAPMQMAKLPPFVLTAFELKSFVVVAVHVVARVVAVVIAV